MLFNEVVSNALFFFLLLNQLLRFKKRKHGVVSELV
jgi:hypothetical protein